MRNSIIYLCTKALHSLISLAHISSRCQINATFTPSIQPNLGLPRARSPLTFAINTLLAIQYSSILSASPNDLNILWSTLLASSLSIFQLFYAAVCIFPTLSICYNTTKLLKHFISRTFIFLLSSFLIPLVCAPYNAVGTIKVHWVLLLHHIGTSSHLSLILHYSIHFSALHKATTSLSHPPSATTFNPMVHKTIHFT